MTVMDLVSSTLHALFGSIVGPVQVVVGASLAIGSTVYAVRARSAKPGAGMSEAQAMRSARKFSTISLAFVSLDYVLKCVASPSPANFAALFQFPIVTGRSAMIWALDFQKGDSPRRMNLQKGIAIGTSVLGVAAIVGSQLVCAGPFDPWTSLNLFAMLFAATADACNGAVSRRRYHLAMGCLQVAFGCYTGAGTLFGKAAVDVGACLWHDPLARHVVETARSLVRNGVGRRRRPLAAPTCD